MGFRETRRVEIVSALSRCVVCVVLEEALVTRHDRGREQVVVHDLVPGRRHSPVMQWRCFTVDLQIMGR